MKKLVILLALCLTLTGCGKNPESNILTATVVEVHENSILVLPTKGSAERTRADRIQVCTEVNSSLEVGDVVKIAYLGELMETSPMQLTDVQSVELVWHNPQITTIPTEAPEVLVLPQRLEMTFSSGAGAWSTTLNLNIDGSFSGTFRDANLGEVGEDHPNGTVRYCDFQGRFQILNKLNDYTYTLTLAELRSQQPEGEQAIEDEVLYISSTPYGLEGGSEFRLYTPEAPVSQLPKHFLSWWPSRTADPKPQTLSQWGLHNLSSEIGFFTAAAPES